MNFLCVSCKNVQPVSSPYHLVVVAGRTTAMELDCAVQKYAWGKLGSTSLVAQLSRANNNTPINEQERYAELWMGTHPSGPSMISGTNESLLSYLQANNDSLGSKEKQVFGTDLPFLFKALSVAKALSIQAHPNKVHAEQLFASRPDLYKDPNHKPEMVTAWLGPFEALCGFRPIAEIQFFIKEIDELAGVVGKDACDQLAAATTDDIVSSSAALRKCFSALMNSSQESISGSLQRFLQRIPSLSPDKKESLLCELFCRISTDFPADVGCWSVYFLNFVTLQEGQSLFLGPNVPHAYISGDCLECMACSDNVVRAGLTPKFKDIDTLCSMLDYVPGPVERFACNWTDEDDYCQVSIPPVPDFAMARLRLPFSATATDGYRLPVRPNASILLVLQGRGLTLSDDNDDDSKKVLQLRAGQILFLKAGQSMNRIRVVQNDDDNNAVEDLVIYQAYANV